MKKSLIACAVILFSYGVVPASAALTFVATPNSPTYSGITSGNMALTVGLDAVPTGSIQFVTGPSLSASPISFSFVMQAGGTGPLPGITSTSTNAAGGWNSVIAPTATTFTAFNFTSQALPPDELVGQLNFTISSASTNGSFDLVASAFALDGVDMPSQVIGTVTVVPEPSGAALLIIGGLCFAVRRRRICD